MGGTLIFDGECGFCTRSRNLLVGLDRAHRVRTMPFQRKGVPEDTGIDRAELARSVYWLDEDGSRCSGAEAINAALSAALGTRIPLRVYRLPGMGRLQERAYRWVSVHRHHLPGTTPWCASHPDSCH